MAFASDSTTAPARPLLPLAFRPSAPVDDPRTADDLLAEIVAEIDRQEGVLKSEQTPTGLPKSGDTSELPPEPLLPADVRHGGAGNKPAQVRSVDRMGNSDVVPNCPDAVGVVAHVARALHLRRQLEAAAEHGADLLAALGLPRLVGPDTIIVDPKAAGDALDLAIATLDAVDGDTDIEDEGEAEPSFGWDARPSQIHLWNGCIQGDLELDTADAEPSLASPERHPRVPDVAWGPVYTARGADEGQLRWAEGAQHDGEAVNEDGDDLDAGEHDTADHESYLGWPEDGRARTSMETAVLTADPDAEHDDVDREDDELDDDRGPEPLAWVFGPSRREMVHV